MRRATIRIEHDEPDVIARAVGPDNTDEMTTTVETQRESPGPNAGGDAVVTRIERETTGGLQSTVDDYVVNVDVAMTVVAHARSVNQPATDASGLASTTTDETSETKPEHTHE